MSRILGRMPYKTAEELMAEANKSLGAGALVLAKDMIIPRRFTTGSLTLDISIGGGLAGNQWSEVYGPENHGKTTIATKAIAANQAVDPNFQTLWVAGEAFDSENAQAMGVDLDRVYLFTTRDMPLAYQEINEYLENRAVDAVVLDSYPALIPPDEDEKAMEEYGSQAEGARMTNKFFRKVGKAGLRNPLDPGDRPWFGLFVNQPREKIGGWAPNGGTPETTPGGRGKNFSFYTRLDVKRAEWLYGPGDPRKAPKVGLTIRTRAVKNKGGPPERVATIDYYFTDFGEFKRGEYDVAKDVLVSSVLFDVVRKGGAWYTYGDRKWQGLDKVLQSVREEPDLMAQIEERTRWAAVNPHDKRTWNEGDVESASTGQTKIRRRKKTDDAE